MGDLADDRASRRATPCTAGYKAIYQKESGYPNKHIWQHSIPELANIVEEKMSCPISPLGAKAGGLTKEAAAWMGLNPGTAVAVANVDAHVTVPAAQATAPGIMTIIKGTSNCHMVNGTHR